MAEIELTLNSPITEEQWDAITDVDFDKTDRIWFHTKHGKEVEFIKVKSPPTNADRIRAMSDEELAEWITIVQGDSWMMGYAGLMSVTYPNSEEAWLDWLKLEVGQDEP